jgi:hypothetical protein
MYIPNYMLTCYRVICATLESLPCDTKASLELSRARLRSPCHLALDVVILAREFRLKPVRQVPEHFGGS